MNPRPTRVAVIVAAVLAAGLLLWLWHGRRMPARKAWHPLVGHAAPAAPEGSDTNQPAGPAGRALLARQNLDALRQRIEKSDARAHEAVLMFKNAAAYQKFLARAHQAGLTVVGQLDALQTVRVRYDSLASLQGEILGNVGDYSEVDANYLMRAPQTPSKEDRAAVNQVPFGNSTLDFLGVTGDHSSWGRDTTIAVLDSGVMPDSTFGQGRLRAQDIGLGTSAGTGAEDGHGTAVAALAAGSSPNAPGVAPAADILSIRVTDASGVSDIFTMSQAIVTAVDAGAKIINVSMGGYESGSVLTQAIDYALAQGAVIVAAAGNDQAAQLTWPAADPRVISVGAVDALGQQVLFSNSGPELQVTAPGYGVQTAWLDEMRVTMDGTSASAPLVAGAIAALMSENPGLTAAQAWQVLQKYSSDGGAPGADADYGNGILNLGWAMNRGNPNYIDTAVASHYFDATTNTMEFVVQNRSGQAVSGLQLDVSVNGASSSYALATLNPGAISVIKLPVDQTQLAAQGKLQFRTELLNPDGIVDQVPANNHKTSTLTAPVK